MSDQVHSAEYDEASPNENAEMFDETAQAEQSNIATPAAAFDLEEIRETIDHEAMTTEQEEEIAEEQEATVKDEEMNA